MNKVYEFLERVDLIKFAVALTILVCLSWIVMALVQKEIPAGNKEIIIHTLGLIEGVVISIAAYYWGSSAGSKQKTEAMEKMIKKE